MLAEMEFTGQAFEEMQEQNVRLLQQLREKDDANLKLMSEVGTISRVLFPLKTLMCFVSQMVTKPDCEPKRSQLSTSSRKSSEKQGENPGRNHNACISVNCPAVPIRDIPLSLAYLGGIKQGGDLHRFECLAWLVKKTKERTTEQCSYRLSRSSEKRAFDRYRSVEDKCTIVCLNDVRGEGTISMQVGT